VKVAFGQEGFFHFNNGEVKKPLALAEPNPRITRSFRTALSSSELDPCTTRLQRETGFISDLLFTGIFLFKIPQYHGFHIWGNDMSVKKVFRVIFLYCLASLASPVLASDVRVDSTGGLDLVLWDETTDINPYNLGNPAGLALLPAGSRFEANAPLYEITNMSGSYNHRLFGISSSASPPFSNFSTSFSPVNETSGSQYQGLLYATPDKWAFQATGGFFDSRNSNDHAQDNYESQERSGLVRASRDFGPLTLGTEFLLTADDLNEPTSNNLIRNSSSGVLNTGLMANLQLGDKAHPSWLRLGGSFALNLFPLQSTLTQGIIPVGTSVLNEKTSGSVYEPCLFLDFPGTFQGGIMVNIHHQTETANFTIGPNYYPDYMSDIDNGVNFAVIYKSKMGTSDPGNPHPLSFNHGGLFEIFSSSGTDFGPTGGTQEIFQDTSYTFQMGMGLEWEKDLTLGFQLCWEGSTDSTGHPPFPVYPLQNSPSFTISGGGEKWLSPYWALRMGLLYEDNENHGLVINDGLFPIYPGQSVTGIRFTTGAGYEDKGLRIDGMVWYEVPSVANAGPDYSYAFFGIQLDGALLFNS
jgi:hypothetical protein